jgi:predicted CoA-binding protein
MKETSEKDLAGELVKADGKPTLVLGASTNPQRTSYTAVHMLRDASHKVYALGGRTGTVADVDIVKSRTDEPYPELPMEDLHTVTLYMNAGRQAHYHDYILSLSPKRIIFNPGAENRVLYDLAQAQGIECREACTLVMLNLGQF